MEAKKVKALSRISRCFFFFLILHLAEELLIIPKLYDTKGIISCVGGFVILLFYIRFINKPLEQIGMIVSAHKIRKGILLAALFNLVPAVIVYVWEFYKHSSNGEHTVIRVFYESTDNAYSVAGSSGFIRGALIGLVIAVVHAFFYEMTFRGLLITLGSRSMRFAAINTIQTALYTFWFLIPVLRLILFYRDRVTWREILSVFIALLIYESLAAVKLGLLGSATGSVWACIFDHIAFAYILDMVHVQTTDANMKVQIDGSYYVYIIAYQVIALLMVYIYYIIKKKKIKENQIH
jgi:hypothetical protein